MNWTTPADLRAQVQKLWDRGRLLSCMLEGETLFPLRLTLKGPSSAELANRFEQARAWIGKLCQGTYYRVEMQTVQHRILGANPIPHAVWVDSSDEALHWIGKTREARRFADLADHTAESQPALMPWLARSPLKALALADEWPLLLNIVAWFEAHPRPGIYLRQIDLPGVHTKFIETHRAVLSELLDLALPPEAIRADANGVSQFCRRYGLRDKPLRIRFRLLDPRLALLPGQNEQDITLDQASFAELAPDVTRVFITENEINFLAFPPVPGSMVIFGAGYGFEALAQTPWLQQRTLYYWGDIDTHGFAILDQLRKHFPHVRSLLMDRETLLSHEAQWAIESTPLVRNLARLNVQERELFDDLRDNRIRVALRLEQERIRFTWLTKALANL
jgi:hypothetical protein